jgi:hypothetical protein
MILSNPVSHPGRSSSSSTVVGTRTIIRTNRLKLKLKSISSISTSAFSLSLLLLLLLLLLSLTTTTTLLPVVDADVRLPEYNRSYASKPGRFGGNLDENDPPVLAHLTLIQNQPYMCPDELKHIQPEPAVVSLNDDNNNSNNYQEGEEINSNNNNNNTLSNNSTTNTSIVFTYDDIEPIPQPPDGLPIAILVERGICTFYDKAIMASKYGDAVKYIIVYDDQIGASELVEMHSEYTTNMTLLFVSSLSGQEMREKIFRNSMGGGGGGGGGFLPDDNDIDKEIKKPPGILVEIDGISPIEHTTYPALNMAAYFLVRYLTLFLFYFIIGYIKW